MDLLSFEHPSVPLFCLPSLCTPLFFLVVEMEVIWQADCSIKDFATRPFSQRTASVEDSGVCICIHVCLVWFVLPTAFIVPHYVPVCRQLQTDSPAQLDSIWTWRNAHMRTESSSPTGAWTLVARLAVQCSTDWATPSSRFSSHKLNAC